MSDCIGCAGQDDKWIDCTLPAAQGDVYCEACRESMDRQRTERVS